MRQPYDGVPSPTWRTFLTRHAKDIWAFSSGRIVDGDSVPEASGPQWSHHAIVLPNAVRRLLAALGLAAEPPPRPSRLTRA